MYFKNVMFITLGLGPSKQLRRLHPYDDSGEKVEFGGIIVCWQAAPCCRGAGF